MNIEKWYFRDAGVFDLDVQPAFLGCLVLMVRMKQERRYWIPDKPPAPTIWEPVEPSPWRTAKRSDARAIQDYLRKWNASGLFQ